MTKLDPERIRRQLKDPRRREDALWRMVDYAMPGSARLAAGYVNDSNPFVRGAALACLRARGTRRWEGLAVEALSDVDAINRVEAIECLVAASPG
jgi:hypothetical protein